MINNALQDLSATSKNNNPNSSKIRILIVDDQNFARERLQMLLESESGLEIVGKVADGATAIEQIQILKPDVVLMDLEMPGMEGTKAIEVINKRFPDCKILVLSIHETEEYVNKALKAGAKGYLLKNTPQQELINGIRYLYKGYSQLSPGLFDRLIIGKPEPESSESSTNNFGFNKLQLSQPKVENKLFRQESLDRLASPERLDQLMRVVNPKSWLPLVTLGSVVLITGLWSVIGRIPVTVDGQGVLIYPSKVIPLQSKSAGQITALNVEEGDLVKKGDVLATVDQLDLRKQLQLAKSQLEQLQQQNGRAESIQLQRQSQEIKAIEEKRQTLQERLQLIESLAPVLKSKGLDSIQRDRQNIDQRLANFREMLPTLQNRLKIRENLFEEGAISDDVLLEARQQYLDNIASENEAKSQLKQLDVKEADALREHLSSLNEIKDIKAQLQELDSRKAQSAQQDIQASTNRQKEIQEVERKIAQLEEQLKNDGRIISQHEGRILETTVSQGQVIQAGTRIANIDIKNLSGKLIGITYFSVENGKKIDSEMEIQITPQTVKRERFGGIVGDITKVSSFPISKEAAAKVIGNSEVVQGLVSDKQQGVMQVFSTLHPDGNTFSGYQWSSSAGPQLKISSGTTTTVRVKIEERAPITFVLPILRSISGIY